MTIDLIEAILILLLGLFVGYAIGSARVHWPLVKCFRDYYRRWANERVAQHARFLIACMNLIGAAAASHKSADAGAEQHSGGLGRSHVISLRVVRMRKRLDNLKRGGRDTESLKDHNKLPLT